MIIRTARKSEKGNVLTILLGGIAMAGVLGYMMYQTMGGPVASMTRVTKVASADAQMQAVSKAVIVDAVRQDLTGDCDSDGYIEAREWAAPTGGAPSGAGSLPSAIIDKTTDPWGTPYGYCVWDVGPKNNPAIDNGCGAGALRLKGSATPTTGAGTLQTAFAVVSAGPDRIFTTTCKTYTAATGDGSNNLIATSGDDLVSSYTYKEAEIAANDLWTLKLNEPTKATINKDLEVGTGGGGNGSITALSLVTDGAIDAGGGVLLADQNRIPDAQCTLSNKGLLRFNSGSATAITAVKATAIRKIPSGTATSSTVQFLGTNGVSDPPPAGSAVIVAFSGEGSDAPISVTSVTDNQSHTYTKIAESTAPAGSKAKAYIFATYNIAAPSGTFTITANFSGGATRKAAFAAFAVTGLAAASAEDKTGTANGGANSGSLAVSASGATAQDNELVVAVHAYDGTGAGADINVDYQPSTGWNQIFVNNDASTYTGFSTVYKVLSQSSTPSHTWTHHAHASGQHVQAALATFKGAVATGTGVTGLQYCDGTDWVTAGSASSGDGDSGPAVAAADIDELNDGVADYTKYIVGLGKDALGSNDSGMRNTAVGEGAAGKVTTGSDNTAMGKGTMDYLFDISGSNNTAFGFEASAHLSFNIADNTAVGNWAGSGTGNTAFGSAALNNNQGKYNTAFGQQAIYGNGDIDARTAVGYRALYGPGDVGTTAFGYQALLNDAGAGNTAFGSQALADNTTGNYNTALGFMALTHSTVSQSTAFGYKALMSNTTGTGNTAAGYNALKANTTGASNTAAGAYALAANTGSDNTAAGYWALGYNTTGSDNSAIGYRALGSNTTGSDNTALGYAVLGDNTQGSGNTGAGMGALALNNIATGIIVRQIMDETREHGDVGDPAYSQASFDTIPAEHSTIIVVAATDGNPITSVTDNRGGAAYTKIPISVDDTLFVFYRSDISLPAGTFTITLNYAQGTRVTWSAMEVSGLAASNVVDLAGSSVSDGGNTVTVSTSGALSQPNELVIAGTKQSYICCNAVDSSYNSTPQLDWESFYTDTYCTQYPCSAFTFKTYSSITTPSHTWTNDPSYTTDEQPSVMISFKGASTPPADYGEYNTAMGEFALYSNSSGDANTAAGDGALGSNTEGSYNTAAGSHFRWDICCSGDSLESSTLGMNTTGSYNTAAGYLSLGFNTTASGNTALGFALSSNTTGAENTAIGFWNAPWNTTGSGNTSMGSRALEWIETGNHNTAIGDAALHTVTGNDNTSVAWKGDYDTENTGNGNTGFGDAMYCLDCNYNTSLSPWGGMNCSGGDYNTQLSYGLNDCAVDNTYANTTAVYAFGALQTGQGNVGIGGGWTNSGNYNTLVTFAYWGNVLKNSNTAAGSETLGFNNSNNGIGENTAIGYDARTGDADGNTAFGYHSGDWSTGTKNTYIGSNAKPCDGCGYTNATGIGYGATPTADNQIIVGNGNVTSIGGKVDWTNASDRRLKKDIQDSDLDLGFIMKLRPVSYRLKDGNGRLDYGFIAQEVEQALDGRVTNMITQRNDDVKTYQLRSSDLLAPIIKGLQERQSNIDSQQHEIDALRARIEEAEKRLAPQKQAQ